MATGSSASPDALGGVAEAIVDRLLECDIVVLATLPAVDELRAAARLVSATPGHARVLGPADEPPIADDALVIGTNPSIDGVDASLSATDPIGDARSIVDDVGGGTRSESLALVDGKTAPGFAAVFDDLGRSISRSTRLYGPLSGRDPDELGQRLEAADLPTSAAACRGDASAAKRLAGWLATTVIESPDRPASAATGLDDAFSPRYVDGPVPTREGGLELLEVTAETDPGLAMAALLDDDHLEEAIARFEPAAQAVLEAVGALPVDASGPLVAAETGDPIALGRTAWLWTAFRLDAPYGLLVGGDAPADVALASTGDRSASALLETVASRAGGRWWGDARLARGHLDADRETIATVIQEAL